jgi:hypothetical protein
MKNIALVAIGTALGFVASSVMRRRRVKPPRAPHATTEPTFVVPQESGAV